jgi:hypothetical protein
MIANFIYGTFELQFGQLLLLFFMSLRKHNARLNEQSFDGGFCAFFCTKGDSGTLSVAGTG